MAEVDVLREIVLPRLQGIRPSGGQFAARCPAHDDKRNSLSIGVGKDQAVLIFCHAGCQSEDVLAAIGLTYADLSDPTGERPSRPARPERPWMPCVRDHGHRVVAEYPYRNADGSLRYVVMRCDAKCFMQKRPDSSSRSGWRFNLEGIEPTIYRLPELLAADPYLNVYVCEGEKDVDRLWSMGQPATCNSGGAGKWRPEFAEHLRGRDVVIVADRDAPGQKHAEMVFSTLTDVARSIEVVVAAEGKDVSDHLDAGLHLGKLVHITEWPEAVQP